MPSETIAQIQKRRDDLLAAADLLTNDIHERIEKAIISPKRISVTRILVVEGEEEWVKRTLDRGAVASGRQFIAPKGRITEIHRSTEDVK